MGTKPKMAVHTLPPPKLPIFPHLDRVENLPRVLYRFDDRSPNSVTEPYKETIFQDGFGAWASGLDLCRHVADWGPYGKLTGFVSTSDSVEVSLTMFVDWKFGGKTLQQAFKVDKEIRIYEENRRQLEADSKSTANQKLLNELQKKNAKYIRKIAELEADRSKLAWCEGWLYEIEPVKYCISVVNNFNGRKPFAGKRALMLAPKANEWDWVFRTPAENIIRARKVRFTRQLTKSDTRLILKFPGESKANPKYVSRYVFNPYDLKVAADEGAYYGLLGFWAPYLETEAWAPGRPDFPKLPVDLWSGEKEYSRAEPRYPFGKPTSVKANPPM